MGKTIYTNRSGLNITIEMGDGKHWSQHFNNQSSGEPIVSVKTPDGQYVKKYNKDGTVTEEFKLPKQK